jgi:hypothetical protein
MTTEMEYTPTIDSGNILESSIYHYLMEWNNKNKKVYIKSMFGVGSIRKLSKAQIKILFTHAIKN